MAKKKNTPLNSKHTDWVDKKDILDHFHISERKLQDLRSKDVIIWGNLDGKFFYYLPSFAEALERSRRS